MRRLILLTFAAFLFTPAPSLATDIETKDVKAGDCTYTVKIYGERVLAILDKDCSDQT